MNQPNETVDRTDQKIRERMTPEVIADLETHGWRVDQSTMTLISAAGSDAQVPEALVDVLTDLIVERLLVDFTERVISDLMKEV